MDNTISPITSPDSCVLKLDKIQYAAYRNSRLEIHSPKGEFLTRIATNINLVTEDDAIIQLWGQACLLEVLFEQMEDRVSLPQKAIHSIAKIIDRIDVHLENQTVK